MFGSLFRFGPPPPSRRARAHPRCRRRAHRTTSAIAESSGRGTGRAGGASDHLRLRGELGPAGLEPATHAGPPPPSLRARGDQRGGLGLALDHLRLRGELDDTDAQRFAGRGPPPPSRRALQHRDHALGADRTTSAFAESSASWPTRTYQTPDHLRLRGELCLLFGSRSSVRGPPPPSRRARRHLPGRCVRRRTTSAFAESSDHAEFEHVRPPDHLRLRGELAWLLVIATPLTGPPPPSRRALLDLIRSATTSRTTSAFAESSPSAARACAAWSDHLRLRGELDLRLPLVHQFDGPPPPSRRARGGCDATRALTRTTSAFAESSRAGPTRDAWRTDHLRLRGELAHARVSQ